MQMTFALPPRLGRRACLGLVLAAAAMLAACGGGSNSSKSSSSGPVSATVANKSPIKVGVLADITGGFATQGADIRIGAEAATAVINAAGGVNGHPLELDFADPKSDPAEAVKDAQDLVQKDHVDVLLGAVGSPECLGIEQLAPKLQTVYMTSAGCANEQLTQTSCNKYTFRTQSVGRQQTIPFSKALVDLVGKRWAMMYQDYAFGQSNLKAYQDAMTAVGGSIAVPIAFPLNEPNIAPYVSKIPTDGSVDGVITGFGGADALRAAQAIDQFGIDKKMPTAGFQDASSTGGTYPPSENGGYGFTFHPANPIAGNQFSKTFDDAFRAAAAKDQDVAKIIGGADRPAGSTGYVAWTSLTTLKVGMVNANFTGRADTEKLITAIENINVTSPSIDYPTGGFKMSKTDHQGQNPLFIFKVNGQDEQIVRTISIDQIPPIGTCKV
jgi:ABC-type branched-subunit amino acid transport system substrate-binding protein